MIASTSLTRSAASAALIFFPAWAFTTLMNAYNWLSAVLIWPRSAAESAALSFGSNDGVVPLDRPRSTMLCQLGAFVALGLVRLVELILVEYVTLEEVEVLGEVSLDLGILYNRPRYHRP